MDIMSTRFFSSKKVAISPENSPAINVALKGVWKEIEGFKETSPLKFRLSW